MNEIVLQPIGKGINFPVLVVVLMMMMIHY
jgi:hypothetical protein